MLFLTALASAAVTCDDGSLHASLAGAAAHDGCAVITLEPGAYLGRVAFDRSVTLVGAGRDETVLFCFDGPCVQSTGGELVLASLSVASTGVAIAARSGRLEMVSSRISPLRGQGGELVLRDASAALVQVELEVATLPAIDAVSRYGNDLDLEEVHVLGVSPRSGARSVMYTGNYGVSCTDCSYDTVRPDTVGELLWGEDGVYAPLTARSASHPYPQLFCPAASADDDAACEAQCGGEVALCRMTYQPMSESCAPRAVCVPTGEIPELQGLQIVRR